ncbi:hypothetical protein TOPH_05257 [Tolypocladium ophioglossoides CBS 100239]|uniref:Carboxypeptidase Y inhibitor n=1 Tax=Tolypocladium ophioglossoides (strain CBS 100239) TaxID=1163406 RepID=A0A0L0N7N8_TOLOC|nr:hypothetical protein TOPH_05257 [Tolypocladium ophioglossoides CBS 100239]
MPTKASVKRILGAMKKVGCWVSLSTARRSRRSNTPPVPWYEIPRPRQIPQSDHRHSGSICPRDIPRCPPFRDRYGRRSRSRRPLSLIRPSRSHPALDPAGLQSRPQPRLDFQRSFVANYIGPAPPAGSPHRYAFFLFERPEDFNSKTYALAGGNPLNNWHRMRYDLDVWQKTAKLCEPLATNYFLSN